jgi:hypothetical protein
MMILLQQNKKGRESGKKCHTNTVMYSKSLNFQPDVHHVPVRQIVAKIRPWID